MARKRRTTRRKRTTSRRRRSSFGGGLVPAGAPKQVMLGTVGFIGVQLIVDKAPIPPNFKKGNARIASKLAAAIAMGYVARKVGKMSAADVRPLVVGAMMSPALDVAGGVIAKATKGGGLRGIEGVAGPGEEDNALGLPDLQADEDELIAMANRLDIAS